MHCSNMNYNISCSLPEGLKVESDVGWDFSLWIYLIEYSLLLKYCYAHPNEKMTSRVHPLSVKSNQKEHFLIFNLTFPTSCDIQGFSKIQMQHCRKYKFFADHKASTDLEEDISETHVSMLIPYDLQVLLQWHHWLSPVIHWHAFSFSFKEKEQNTQVQY